MLRIRGLLIGEREDIQTIIQKSLGVTLEGGRENLKNITKWWKRVFPNDPLFSTLKRKGGALNPTQIYYLIFDSDEELVEFKLRYL